MPTAIDILGTFADSDELLTRPATTATAVKFVGDATAGRVGGYLVVWGSPEQRDLQGEYFTPDSDLKLDWYDKRPVLYHHTLDAEVGTLQIGEIVSLKADNVGLWAEAQLDMRNRYVAKINDLVNKGVLGWSSGSIPHMVQVAADGHIKRWPIVEGSLTPTPAEPRKTTVSAIKSALASAAKEPLAEEQSRSDSAKPDQNQATRIKAMDLQAILTALLNALMEARPDVSLTPDEQSALLASVQQQMASTDTATMSAPQVVTAAQPVLGKAFTDLVTNKVNAKKAFDDAIKAAADATVKAQPPKNPLHSMTGNGGSGQQPQQERNQISQISVKTKYGDLNEEDMSYLWCARQKYNAARGRGPVAFTDAEERAAFLKEMAEKAGKSYQGGKIRLGDEAEEARAIKSINAIKNDELDHSTQASFGDEWVPDLWSSQIWNRFRLDAVIANLFKVVEMPSDPFELPIEGGDPTVYFVPETKNETDVTWSASTNPTPDSKVGSGKVTLASKKLALRVGFSEELVEDSIIPVISMYREQAQKALLLAVDSAVLNGDTLAALNVNLDGGTPPTTAVYKAFDGLRKLALITASPVNSVDMGGIAPTIAKVRQARFTMPAARASKPGEIAYITHGELYAKLLSLGEVITVDKYGPQATVLTGELGKLDGSALLLTDQLGLTASNGKISNSGGSNTLGSLVGVHKPSWVMGYRRKVTVNVDRIPATDSYQMSASVRVALVSIDSEGAFVLYNILV